MDFQTLIDAVRDDVRMVMTRHWDRAAVMAIGAQVMAVWMGRWDLVLLAPSIATALLLGAAAMGASRYLTAPLQRDRAGDVAALIITGFLGGYTTFSSYQMETVILHKAQAYRTASLYWFGSVVAGLAAAALGAWAIRLTA